MESRTNLIAIDTNTFIEEYRNEIDMKLIPLIALRQKTKILLSKLLNPQKILLSEEGYARDWRGLADLAGLADYHGTILTNNCADPMSQILQILAKKPPAKDEEKNSLSTFHELETFLGIIDRWDVADDIQECLIEDAKFYLTKRYDESLENDTTITISPPPQIKTDTNILTIDDASRSREGLPPQNYDGFVLFADEDIDFATELIERMEDYGFKLCVKERDLIGGVSFEHEAILRLISERCNRLIVVISPSFLKSRYNTFFVNFAQALGIEEGRRKIVPLLYERCILPPTLNFYFLLNYQRSGRLWNFWEKLKDSIKSTPTELNERPSQNLIPSIQITEVDSSESSKLQIELPKESAAPIKIPRSKRNENKKAIFSLQDSSPTNEDSSILMNSPTDSLKLEFQQIMPPRQKPRNSTSMIDLTQTSLTTSTIDMSCDKSRSNLTLNSLQIENITGPTTENSQKKLKWYKKILSPSSNDIASKEKPKKKWFRKNKTSLSG